MSKASKIAIWGTGSLCVKFLEEQNSDFQADLFVDSKELGEFNSKPMISPAELGKNVIEEMIICSSYFNEIIPQCLSSGVSKSRIFVVLSKSLQKVPLSEFTRISENEYYFLPWTQMSSELKSVMSNDIMFPDNYKDIARSIAYAFVSSVEGDFAEFGTCSGYSASLMANTIEYYSRKLQNHERQHQMSQRKLCLFDSFQGFPEANTFVDRNSPHVASGAWGTGTAKGLSAPQLRQLCSQFLALDQIEIYEGWYKDTLSIIPETQKFSCVHMDCDLYESTFDVLQHLLTGQHLSEGTLILFDNWYSNKASKSYGEQRAWIEINETFDIEFSSLGMYGCVGERKIIHNYKKRNN